jgi:hypothetical protein
VASDGTLADPPAIVKRTIAAGSWFGAAVANGGSFALAGCTVAPGFDFRDFERGESAALVRRYPQHRALIERLTRWR